MQSKESLQDESVGLNPHEELNDSTLNRIVQDLYSQAPTHVPDLGMSESPIPDEQGEEVSQHARPDQKPPVSTDPGHFESMRPDDQSQAMDASRSESSGNPMVDSTKEINLANFPLPHVPESRINAPQDYEENNPVDMDSQLGEQAKSPKFPMGMDTFSAEFIIPPMIEFTRDTEAADESESGPMPDSNSLPLNDPGSITQDTQTGALDQHAPGLNAGFESIPVESSGYGDIPDGFVPDMDKIALSEGPESLQNLGLNIPGNEMLSGTPSSMPSASESPQVIGGDFTLPQSGFSNYEPSGSENAASTGPIPLQSPYAPQGANNQPEMMPENGTSGMPSGEVSEMDRNEISEGWEHKQNYPQANDIGSSLNIESLRSLATDGSVELPRLFGAEQFTDNELFEKINPANDHPIAEGLANTLIKPFSPTVNTDLSNYQDGANQSQSSEDEAEQNADDKYEIKNDFPALQQNIHGKPLIWLDSAATSQKPHAVIERVKQYYHRENSNVHRGAHTMAARSTNAYEEAREKVQTFLKAESKKEIVFVRGATEGINLVAQAWGRKNVSEGDEILITEMEHHSNIVAWQFLAREQGAVIRVVPFSDRGEIDLNVYAKLLNEKTKIASFAHVSNVLGTINPIKQMTEMAQRYGAKVLIDGCQSIPHMSVNVQDIGCDFLVFSGHKVYAPTGIGVLYGKRELLEEMPPWQGGGSMIEDVTFEKTEFSDIPAKFEAGTGNIAGAVGLGAAIDYLNKIGMEIVEQYEHELMDYAMQELGAIPGLTLIGTAQNKAGAISFLIEDLDPVEIGVYLDHEGIAVRAGHHCAQPTIRHYGVESTVRPSLGIYNTTDDIDELVKALYKAKKAL